jgi:hypothetical protein
MTAPEPRPRLLRLGRCCEMRHADRHLPVIPLKARMLDGRR